ncbi:MAG: M15 family metallopeptidase [Ruminococcus flavefaciens]|nr:M15 family metallopeptidase [Ruminococcus flavefaciens]
MKRKNRLLVTAVIIVAGMSMLKYNQQEKIPNDWRLILVNESHSIPHGYSPELIQLPNGIRIDERIYPDFQRMSSDAEKDGIYMIVGEGYRTHEEQQKMMSDKVEGYIDEGYSRHEAKKLARNWVAVAGKSEHETGLALDINADTSQSTDEEVYNWLAENAHIYGFILRYPSGKEDITGISYEPWHYRYVGTDTALEIHEMNITLEEYLSD